MMVFLIVPTIILFSGCTVKEPEISFKVEGGYVQYYDGKSWNNLISVEELSGKNGQDGSDGEDADVWTIGNDGYWYVNNERTDNKALGTQGNGIKSIEKDLQHSNSDKTVYVITMDNNYKYAFEVLNGINPIIEISEDGYWVINYDKTEVKALAIEPEIEISQDGYWVINNNKTQTLAKGKDGSVVTIGDDFYWYIDGVKSEFKAAAIYQITYDYGYENHEEIYLNYKEVQNIETTEWLTNMPEPIDTYVDDFDGWYVEGTNKKIENYDFVGGDVTLEARWNYLPSGLYNGNVYSMSWADIKDAYPNAFGFEMSYYDETIWIDSFDPYDYANDTSFFANFVGDLVIDRSVNWILDYAFKDCKNITSITFPNTIECYSWELFTGCDNLTDIYLDVSNLFHEEEYIFPETFMDVESLTNIYLSENIVEGIDGQIFMYTTNLEKIMVNQNNDSFVDIDGVLFSKDKKTLIACPANYQGELYENGQFVSIYDNYYLIEIGDYAYYGNKRLRGADFRGVSKVGSYAYANCSMLDEVDLGYFNENIGDGVFSGTQINEILYYELNSDYPPIDVMIGYKDGMILDCDEITLYYMFLGRSDNIINFEIPSTVTTIKGLPVITEPNKNINELYIPESVVNMEAMNYKINIATIDSAVALKYFDLTDDKVAESGWLMEATCLYVNENIYSEESEESLFDLGYTLMVTDKPGYAKYVLNYSENQELGEPAEYQVEVFDVFTSATKVFAKVYKPTGTTMKEVTNYTVQGFEPTVGDHNITIVCDGHNIETTVKVYDDQAEFIAYILGLLRNAENEMSETQKTIFESFEESVSDPTENYSIVYTYGNGTVGFKRTQNGQTSVSTGYLVDLKTMTVDYMAV